MTRAQNTQEYEAQMADYTGRRDAAMQEAGVAIGDTVEYHNVSAWGHAEVLTGTVYLTKRGQPKVRTASGTYGWHKGWKKNG